MKKLLLLALGVVTLSGCTQIERFSTEKMLPDYTGSNAARIRVTTDEKLFAIPNSDCIDLEKTVSANNQYGVNQEREKMGFFEKIITRQTKSYEDLTKSIGMPKINVSDVVEYIGNYASREYRIEAGKPITFFIKNKKTSDFFSILLSSSLINDHTFAVSFIPEKGQDYQIVYTNFQKGDYIHYRAALYNITSGKPIPVNFMTSWAKECQPAKK